MEIVMPVYMPNRDGGEKVLFQDGVIAMREYNGYHDSDFYVIAWDDENQKITKYEYATTRFAGGGTASLDVTAENKAKADAWAYKKLRRDVFAGYLAALRKPVKGDTVTVVKGRKVPVGTTGVLFWVGPERVYGGYSEWSKTRVQKVGIAMSDAKDAKGRYTDVVWTYMANIEADIKPKFKLSEIKGRLRHLKKNGTAAWTAFLAYPTLYIQ
jgi:hypothetical protein